MKVLRRLLVLPIATAFCLLPCWGQPPVAITSPDHPQVWYNRSGDKLSQYLSWDRPKGELVLHVAYSTVGNTSAVWRDQSLIDQFDLTFPTVHLDAKSNRLYATDDRHCRTSIGHCEAGVFGNRVVLDDNVELSAHRQNGVMQAAIVSSAIQK